MTGPVGPIKSVFRYTVFVSLCPLRRLFIIREEESEVKLLRLAWFLFWFRFNYHLHIIFFQKGEVLRLNLFL